jgi:hypothetical protein
MTLSLRVIVAYQRVALVLSFWVHRRLGRPGTQRPISWVVGPDETASMVAQIARVVPRSYSVSFTREAAYTIKYDYKFVFGEKRAWLERVVMGPILLGRLMNQVEGFLYNGSTGFLLEDVDQRNFEFAFVKKAGLPIVCHWCGSDIRSTKRMHEMEAKTGLPNISTYIGATSSVFESQEWDDLKRKVAAVADRYASAMFSWEADQLGYLKTPTEMSLYYLPEVEDLDSHKFDAPIQPVVVHASTSPIIKGTQLVRAAVGKLRAEGYDFEYVELIGASNARVLAELRRAHIVLNQFYGFTPAVFGAEAMMNRCVVLMSADETVEPELPPGSNSAWVVTRYYEVYDNLKRLLDDPALMEPIAQRGLEWARENASETSGARHLMRVLDGVLDKTYVFPEPKLAPSLRLEASS